MENRKWDLVNNKLQSIWKLILIPCMAFQWWVQFSVEFSNKFQHVFLYIQAIQLTYPVLQRSASFHHLLDSHWHHIWKWKPNKTTLTSLNVLSVSKRERHLRVGNKINTNSIWNVKLIQLVWLLHWMTVSFTFDTLV